MELGVDYDRMIKNVTLLLGVDACGVLEIWDVVMMAFVLRFTCFGMGYT